jgi:hypothetical protein
MVRKSAGPTRRDLAKLAGPGPLVAAATASVVSVSGRRRGTEIVQLYAADAATGVALPAQQLIGFARIDLESGQSKAVSFEIPMSLLAYTGLSGDLMIEPGSYGRKLVTDRIGKAAYRGVA